MESIKDIAIQVIDTEANSILGLKDILTDDFTKVVELILNSKGNVIVSGIGKSANIAQKIVATLNSTGTTAVFMHAADAIHGDLGIIRDEDIVIIISKSGETPEIKVLTPLIKIRKNKLVAIVGNTKSYLAAEADYVLNTTVPIEACPNNLAPTASTTAQLVMGDALAIALLKCRGFSSEDFAKFHPGGALGKRLYLRVGDVCVKNAVPMVNVNDIMTKVILEISEKLLGATAVMENDKMIYMKRSLLFCYLIFYCIVECFSVGFVKERIDDIISKNLNCCAIDFFYFLGEIVHCTICALHISNVFFNN